MESNFTFIKDVLPEAYSIAWNLEQDIIKGIPSHADDIGHFLELIAVDMVNKKIKQITKYNISFRECISKLRDNNPTIISRAFYDKLGDAYDLRNKCIHTDKKTNTIFKPKMNFYVDLLKDLFYIAVFYYRTIKDKDFSSPEYILPYKLDRLKFKSLDEEGQHKLEYIYKEVQEGRLPSEILEKLNPQQSESSNTSMPDESILIETEGLKDNIEVSDDKCGIFVNDSDNDFKSEKTTSLDDFSIFLRPIKISNNEHILKKCLICGNETDDSNVCTDCLKKINFSKYLQPIKNNFKNVSFDKDDLINLGYTQYEAENLITILKDFSLIKEFSGSFTLNNSSINNFLCLQNVSDVEKLFVSYYKEDISSKEITESRFYHLGKEGNAVFNRFYIISSYIKFNRYIKDLTEDMDYEEAEEKNYISNEEIVNWYKERLNRFIQTKEDSSEEDINFIQKFILITEVLMNKWLELRADNLTKNEINNKLGLSNEITNFWFKKAIQYNFNEAYEIFDAFSLKKEIVDMFLILRSISDDKSREEIANDANVKISELNNYYELGMKKVKPYDSFYNEFKNNYVYKRIGLYIDNLKDNYKSSEAQIKTKITSDELQDWYNQGKIDFITADPKTERFINFFFLRTIILSNRWLSLRQDAYSFKEASEEIEVSVAEVNEWLEFGRNNQYEKLDGYELFKNLFLNNQEIIIDSVISSLNHGKSLEEAAAKENLTVEDLDGFYELGRELTDDEIDMYENTFYEKEEEIYTLNSSESDRKPYDKYFEYIKYDYFPKKRMEYLNLLTEGKSKSNAAKICQLDIEDINDWYSRGKIGESEYIDFYNEYLKIKLESYKDNLANGKSKKDALKSSDLNENEILRYEEEIKEEILKKRFVLVLKAVKSGNNSDKIARKYKLNQSDIFEWFERGLNGESDYIDFYKEYFDNYVSIGIEIVPSYFAMGLNKKQVVKRIKKEGINLDVEDINHWQRIGLLLDEKEYQNPQKTKESYVEDGIEVDNIGDIEELNQNYSNLSIMNICLFDDNLELFVEEETSYESRITLNPDNIEDNSKIFYMDNTIKENYDEFHYSKRLQSAYLEILSNEDFNDYENIWNWVLKKADNPDFDISSIFNEKINELDSIASSDAISYGEESISYEVISEKDDDYVSDSFDRPYGYEYDKDELFGEDKENHLELVYYADLDIDYENDGDSEIEIPDTVDSSLFDDEAISEAVVSSSLVREAISEITSTDSESFYKKLQYLYGDKLINKELTNSIKEEYDLPYYVIEFLINKFTDNGVDYESIKNVLKYSFKPTHKPDTFEIVDKVSVNLVYKSNKYIASFDNLGEKIEISPSILYLDEKLLSDNAWVYVKLSNEGKLSIDYLEIIESPYFNIDKLIDNRKEFTKEEWIDLLITSCGINPNSLNYETKLLLLIRLVPFVENNFYLCDISNKESLKDIFYKNINLNNAQVNESLYGLFYNQQKHKKGIVSYFDSVCIYQFANIKDINKKDSIIDYLNQNRDYNNTSLIFSNNKIQDIADLIKFSKKTSKIENSILFDPEFLVNIHAILPSWDNEEFNNLARIQNIKSEDYGFSTLILSEYFNKLREFNYQELYGKYFRLGKALSSNDLEAIKLMSSGLIKLLYPDDVYTKEDIREIIEICLKSRKYIKDALNQDNKLSYFDLENVKEIFI